MRPDAGFKGLPRQKRAFQLEGTAQAKAQRDEIAFSVLVWRKIPRSLYLKWWKTRVIEMQFKSADRTLLCSFKIVLLVFLR